jgi:hypothetical protein
MLRQTFFRLGANHPRCPCPRPRTAPVKTREQITPHQDSGLDIDERRSGVNIVLVAELDDIQHRL